jgi:hypothetical protein
VSLKRKKEEIKMKKTLSVDIPRLERFWNIDLHAFEPGETYPISQLMDALGFFHVHGRPKLKSRGNTK